MEDEQLGREDLQKLVRRLDAEEPKLLKTKKPGFLPAGNNGLIIF
jgi:hypothetical protein